MDLYVTVLRRKFLPPMMEHFQDIIVQSKFDFSYDLKNDEDTVNYYHYNLNVLPNPGILYAIAYLESLLSIFGKINGNVARDLKR